MLLFSDNREPNDVLRIGLNTVSIEYNGDGVRWREITKEDGSTEYDPIYPWFAIHEIHELSDEDIEYIGEAVKKHLTIRKNRGQSHIDDQLGEVW